MQPIVEWGAGLEPAVLRTVGLVAAGLGAFIGWSVRSLSRSASTRISGSE